MDLELVQTLSESSIFRNKDYLDRFSSDQNSNLLYLYTVAVYLLSVTNSPDIVKYVSKTALFGNFDYFRNSGTDLYMLVYLQKNNRYFSTKQYLSFLNSLKHTSIPIYSFLISLEVQTKVKDFNVVKFKRKVSNWGKITISDKKNVVQELIGEIRKITYSAEIIEQLRNLLDSMVINESTTVSIPISTIKQVARELGMVDMSSNKEHDERVLAALDDYFKTLNDGQYSPLSGEHNNASTNTEVFAIAKKHSVDPAYLMKYLSDTALFDKFQKMASLKDIGDFKDKT